MSNQWPKRKRAVFSPPWSAANAVKNNPRAMKPTLTMNGALRMKLELAQRCASLVAGQWRSICNRRAFPPSSACALLGALFSSDKSLTINSTARKQGRITGAQKDTKETKLEIRPSLKNTPWVVQYKKQSRKVENKQ
jgi:hypothetical protein